MQFYKLKSVLLILIIGIFISSCENKLSINEEDISKPVSDVLTILFDNNSKQVYTDTSQNFSQYFSNKYENISATYCLLDSSNTSTKICKGKIIRISGILKTGNDSITMGKEIFLLCNIESITGTVINGKFERELYSSDNEINKSSILNGFIKISNLPAEIVYLNNLKNWNDGGISGTIEMKGKSKLLFERTGSTLFFENSNFIGKSQILK